MLVYGLLIDKSGERGTIILAGVGFLGLDSVAKSEPAEKKAEVGSKQDGT